MQPARTHAVDNCRIVEYSRLSSFPAIAAFTTFDDFLLFTYF